MSSRLPPPVVFSPAKPLAWWRRPSVVPVIVAGVFAVLLGLWMYAARTPGAMSVAAGPTVASGQGAAPDAVQRVLAAGKPTVVEFGANNCVSCREMKPVLQALALDPRIAVADVDILKERHYISRYQIRLMPTQVFYNAKGEETGRNMGKISGEDILARLGVAPMNPAPGAPAPKAAL